MSSGSQADFPDLPPAAAAARPGVTRRFATTRTVTALVLREMSTRYGRSPGGYIWALLEPLGGIVMLTIGFSLLLRSPPLGTSFILFYTTGIIPFFLYMNLSNTIARSIKFSKPLLYYPAVTWMDAIIARFILNTLTNVTVACILLPAILAFTDTRTVIDMGPIITAMSLAALTGLGVGVLNCALMGLSPAWDNLWGILTRPIFLASGIFYTYEGLPAMAQDILWYNPLVHVTGLSRTGFYPMYEASYVSITYVAAFAVICLAMGIILMGRFHRTILNT